MGINVPSARGPKKNPWINRRIKCNNQVNTWAQNSMDYVWLGWRKFMMDSETRPSIMDYTWNHFTIHHPQACIDNHITRSILDGYKLILTSLLAWDYLRSPAKKLFFCRVSKIGRGESAIKWWICKWLWRNISYPFLSWLNHIAMAIGHERI